MASVIGFDIGNLQSKIGLARNRGIDIITNETSNRATPSLISFGHKSRAIGEAAKTQETSNYKNTIGSLKRLVGRSFNDSDIQQFEKKFINTQLLDVNGTIGIQVQFLGKQRTFTATQLYGMYLAKLRDIAHVESKAPVNNVVIAVPGWYTDVQRRAVLDAAEIAGLNALRLINEGTATAFGYGITKTDLPAPEEKARNVAFIDIGHSDYSVTIASFSKTGLTVKAAAYDRHFGGRDLDYALVEYFAEEFKTKYKIDVMSNQKAVFRLQVAVERLKKILSANIQAPLNVESIMDDIDASSSLTRETFENLIAHLLDRTLAPLETAIAESGFTKDDIDAIELIGGTTRVPSLRQRIQDFFGKAPSVTTNQDEAVARGATLACATLSPVFRVREFTISDITSYPIDIVWEKVPEDEDISLELFNVRTVFPSTKIVTLQRSDTFELEARYSPFATLPGSTNPWLSKITVKGITSTVDGLPATIKVKSRVNQHGIFNFEGATLYETADDLGEIGQMDSAEKSAQSPNDSADVKKAKRTTSKKELPIIVGSTALEKSLLNSFREQEGEIYENDKLVADTEDRKNALEEYIYDTRDKLDATFASYVLYEEKETIRTRLDDTENWLYSDEGENATKSAYVSKLDSLRVLGDPVAFRYKEAEERPVAVKKLREALSKFYGKATGTEERYAHISSEDNQRVVERVAMEEKWLNDQTARQAERAKTDVPAFTCADTSRRREELVYFCNGIFNRPKPASSKSDPPAPSTEQPGPQESEQSAKDFPQDAPKVTTDNNMDVD